jgi:hypothetical protein
MRPIAGWLAARHPLWGGTAGGADEPGLGLLRAEMQRLGWNRAALRRASKGDERKGRLAVRIRQDTTLSLKWIAEHLAMGSWTHVSNLLVWNGLAKV